MITVSINEKCRKILDLLLDRNEYVTLQQIAIELKISKRSVYYELCKINEWLSGYHIPELEIVRGKGLFIEPAMRQITEEMLQKESNKMDYVFSPMERVKLIICRTIYSHHPVYIEQFSEYCQVSRNTIFSDLRVVVNQLQEYNLALEYKPKIGYLIHGDIIRVRALFLLYFTTLLPLFEDGVLPFFDQNEIRTNLEKLKAIATELKTQYVDGVLLSLAALLPTMALTRETPYFPDLRPKEVQKTREYQLVEQYFPTLHEKEKIYLCLHLMGSRTAMPAERIFADSINQSIYELVKALIAEFEKKACIAFHNRDELEHSLFTHISTSIYRYQYGIQIGNPIYEDVMREYPNLFDITKNVCKYMEQLVGLPIPDSEVAYLTLHFGAHLTASNIEDQPLRILIVCANGVSTGNMLKREIQQLLPQAKIVAVVAAIDAVCVQSVCDLVISTVRVKSAIPHLLVPPILTDYDRHAILSHPLIKQNKQFHESSILFNILKKYVQEEDYDHVKRDIRNYFQGGNEIIDFSSTVKQPGLIEFLQAKKIIITKEKFSWQEAVRYAGKVLQDAGSIEKRYLDTVISQLQYYGPFMFVAPGLILIHAKPEDGANRLDVSMTIFKNPVVFSPFYQAKVAITLATEVREKHLRIIKEIMAVFSVESRIDAISKLEDDISIIDYLQEIILDD